MGSIKNSNNKTKTCKDLLVWCFALALMAAIAVGGVEQGPTGAGPNEGAALADVSAVGAQVDISADNKIQLINFKKDTGIRDALTLLALKFNRNIVPSPNVDGVLAFTTLKDVTFEKAIDAILGEGFKYEADGNFIKVYTADEYKKIKENEDRMICKVFTLYYITAQEAEKLITPVLSSKAKIQSTTAAEKEISGGSGGGSGSGSGGAGGLGSGGAGGLSSASGGDTIALHDTIVVYDFPESIEKAEQLIRVIDIRPKQVLVEATILTATLTEATDIGVDWNLLNGVSVTDFPSLQPGDGTHIETAGFALPGVGLRIGVSSDNVQGFIRALETVTDVTVLANPKILAVNKQEGSVLIGTNLGYRSSTTISTGGVATEGEVEFLRTGTQLVFRAYIGKDGYIRMDIYPKDSSATLNEDGVPTENTTEVRTNVMVKDGETIVIGGLFRDVITRTRTQVPLLGNLPIIGAIFRGTTDTTERQEVIVLLTPHIIGEPNETNGPDRADDVGRKRSGATKGLQWIGSARIAEHCYTKAVEHYGEGDQEAALRELNLALELRPTYLEALRLKEKILQEIGGQTIERTMLEDMDRQESDKWLRK